MSTAGTNQTTAAQTTVAGSRLPEIRLVTADRPWAWVNAGWKDMWQSPRVSLTYGALFTAVTLLLIWGLTLLSVQAMILSLTGGFFLLGPLFAVGLYDTSRRLELGQPTSLSSALAAPFAAEGQLSFLGIILLVGYLVWVELALMLFMLFLGPVTLPPLDQFIPTLLFTPNGLGLLIVGSLVGALLAAIVFAISAVSIPMLLERKTDAVTSILTSVTACRNNIPAMSLWAAIIVASMAAAIATCGIGLIFAFPLIGHATWHAYKDLVGPSAQ